MRYLLIFAVMLLAVGALSGCMTSDAVDRSPATRFATKAIGLGDRLIVLDRHSDLWTIDPTHATAERLAAAPGNIVDLCAPPNAQGFFALVKLDEDVVRVDEWKGGKWAVGVAVSLEVPPERIRYRSPPGLACDDKIYISTPEQLLEVEEGKPRKLRLAPAIEPDFADYHLLSHAGALWVGVDAGEWGGAIRRIDPNTGAVQVISSETWPGICSGPLSADCDSVFALAPSPWRADCIVAAVGSLHLTVNGRLLEVCDTRVTRLYFRRLDNDDMWDWIKHDPMIGGEPALTVGFYGFARHGGELVALGFDGIYRFAVPTKPQIAPLPRPDNMSGFGIAEVLPEIYIVQSRPPDMWPDKGPVYDGSQYLLVGLR